MPQYQYLAARSDGSLAEGVVIAADPDAAADSIWSQGLTPFKVHAATRAGVKWWQREVFTSRGVAIADLAAFTREFATLIAADIALDDALRILVDQASSPRVSDLVRSLMDDVLNGATLSDAMQKQDEIFPADYIAVVRAGEAGAMLGEVFTELAELLDRRLEIRSSIQSALIYPAMLVFLGVATLAIIVGALVPNIAPIFTQNGKEPPATIQFLLAVQSMWLEIGLAAVIAGWAAVVAYSVALRKPAIRLAIDRRILQLPLVGGFLLQQDTARFVRTLGTMLKAGVPLVQAAKSARDTINNRYLSTGVGRAIASIQQGTSVHEALKAETMIPSVATKMIAVGEETGKLSHILLRIATMFERQSKNNVDRFMAALTPSLTVAIALMVGALLLPVMNAVLSINDLVGN